MPSKAVAIPGKKSKKQKTKKNKKTTFAPDPVGQVKNPKRAVHQIALHAPEHAQSPSHCRGVLQEVTLKN